MVLHFNRKDRCLTLHKSLYKLYFSRFSLPFKFSTSLIALFYSPPSYLSLSSPWAFFLLCFFFFIFFLLHMRIQSPHFYQIFTLLYNPSCIFPLTPFFRDLLSSHWGIYKNFFYFKLKIHSASHTLFNLSHIQLLILLLLIHSKTFNSWYLLSKI